MAFISSGGDVWGAMRVLVSRCLAFVSLLIGQALVAGGDELGREQIPDDFRVDAPLLAVEDNAVIRLEEAVGKLGELPKPSPMEILRDLRDGRIAEEDEAWTWIESLHATSMPLLGQNGSLRGMDAEPVLSFFRVIQAEQALSKRAALENRHDEARRHAELMVAWNRWIRAADPNLLQAVIAVAAARMAWDAIWFDWGRCPDQEARLRALVGKVDGVSLSAAEWEGIAKREVESYVDSGGIGGFLKVWEGAGEGIPMMREPFRNVSVAELRELPLDEGASLAMQINENRKWLAFLKSGKSFRDAPLWDAPPEGRTLAGYRRMDNGLGHLLDEQIDPVLTAEAYAKLLCLGPVLRTGIAWLELEARGLDPRKNLKAERDPMTGEALRLEFDRRMVRSAGADGEFDDASEVAGIIGLPTGSSGVVLVLPEWRSGAGGE